ncbi:MAG: hypothetical protein K940chlam5_00315 [Candidatus Anoxychlamydiales bacterium]|nr:hypothetical protein [Candidatus Anoxychlamydiales bacterium]
MTTYAIKITQEILGSDDKLVLFSKPLKSEDHIAKLKKRLILDDTKLSRYGNYFTETKKALKIQNVVSRIFHTITAFFSDLITWPSNYKTRFIENIPVRQYLLKKGLNEGYLLMNKELPKYIHFITKEEGSDGNYTITRKMQSKDATLSNISLSEFFHRGYSSWSVPPDDLRDIFTHRFPDDYR